MISGDCIDEVLLTLTPQIRRYFREDNDAHEWGDALVDKVAQNEFMASLAQFTL